MTGERSAPDFLRAPQPYILGYSISEISQMLASVPLDIASHLEQLLILLQEKSMARISCLKSLYKLHTDAINSQDFNQNSSVDTLCSLESDSGPYALLIATYQPSSQRFERADLNQRMEDLLGVPWVTDAGLRTTRGLAIPMPAWDSLCMLIDTMLHLSTSTGIRYFRCCSAHHRRNRFILVSGTQSKVFNSVGEVVQVPFHLSAHCPKDPGHLPGEYPLYYTADPICASADLFQRVRRCHRGNAGTMPTCRHGRLTHWPRAPR